MIIQKPKAKQKTIPWFFLSSKIVSREYMCFNFHPKKIPITIDQEITCDTLIFFILFSQVSKN